VGGVTAIFLVLALLLFLSKRRKQDNRLSIATEAGSQAQLSPGYQGSQMAMAYNPESQGYLGPRPEAMYQYNPVQPSPVPAAFATPIRSDSNARIVSSATQDTSWSQFSGASSPIPAIIGASAVQARSPTASTPTESVKTPAPSTLGSFQQTLSEEQVDFVAGLYRQGIPAPEVARIVERMLREGGSGPVEGSSSGAVARNAAPPEYDFKSAS
jgi:hypothetical protein